MRIHVTITECEIKTLERLTGYNAQNYMRGRIEKLALTMPEPEEAVACLVTKLSFTVKNEETIRRIDCFCRMNKITPAALVRRLAVDPLVLQHLAGAGLDV